MADPDIGGFDPEAPGQEPAPAQAGNAAKLVSFAGAALSLALIVGLLVWGYELLMRDVTGIPVVRALEGPMRVQPEEPGGDRAPHQGLAVNRIAAEGDAAPPPEEIVLAPRSADLEAEDLARGVLRTVPALARRPEPRPAPAEPSDPIEAAILVATTQVMAAEADLAGGDLAGDDLDGGDLAGDDLAGEMPATPADTVVIPASVPGPARSPRPRPRPAGPMLASAAPADSMTPAAIVPAAVAPADEIDPASLAPGTRLVQFGAFDSAAEAREAWAGLAARFGALMDGKDRVVEAAETGGRVFYRLRAAGFDDLADTRRFCAAVIADKGECIPVLTR